jgi:hypothetical protein
MLLLKACPIAMAISSSSKIAPAATLPACSAAIFSRPMRNTRWGIASRRWGRSTRAPNRIARGAYREREASTTPQRGRLLAPRATENHAL